MGQSVAASQAIWVLVLLVALAMVETDKACDNRYAPPGKATYIHENATIHGLCCVNTTCSRGTWPVPCKPNTSDHTVQCHSCPWGTFQPYRRNSVYLYVCKPWRPCSEVGTLIAEEGTPEQDRVCGCDETLHYAKVCSHGQDDCSCEKKWCESGKQLDISGYCFDCPPGWWKADHGFKRCEPAKNCSEGQRLVNKSTTTTDTVCQDIPKDISTGPPIQTTEILTTAQATAIANHGLPLHILLGVVVCVLTVIIILGLAWLIRCHMRSCVQHEVCKRGVRLVEDVRICFRGPPKDKDESSSGLMDLARASRITKQNQQNENFECRTVDLGVEKAKPNGYILQAQMSKDSGVIEGPDIGVTEGPGNGDLLKGGGEVPSRSYSSDGGSLQGNPKPQFEGITLPQYEVVEEGSPSSDEYIVEESLPNRSCDDRDSGSHSIGPQDVESSKDNPVNQKFVIKNLVMHGGSLTIGDHARTNLYEGQKVDKSFQFCVEEEEDCVASPFDPAQVHGLSSTQV